MSALKPAVNSRDHHHGNVNAAIILVEYGDFQCPYCRRAHPLVKRLLEEEGDDLHFVFRNFPLTKIHPLAYAAAVAAEAAGKQGKFWEMHDLIFENQNKLTSKFLLLLAKNIGLDLDQFAKDSDSEEILNKIDNDFESGIRSGVNQTPTFFLNGSRVLTYDETYESLLNAVRLESETRQR
jgi:protein-disulfide isomerase